MKKTTICLLFLLFYTATGSFALAAMDDDDILKLNEGYKLERKSTGEVIIYSDQQGQAEDTFTFKDFYADVLLAAYRNQRMDYAVRTISSKYYYSEDECRREMKHALNVLEEWNIVSVERPG